MRYAISSVIVFIAILTQAAAATAPSDSDAERFLADLETVQRQITSLEIKGENRRYDIDRETGALKESPYNKRFTISMDRLPQGRVRLDNESVVPWKRKPGEAERPVSIFAQHAYNGDVRTYINWSETREPINQEISAGQPPYVGAISHRWGIDLLASTYNNMGLARLLRHKEGRWSLEDRGAGLYAVSYPREDYEGDDVRVELFVDLSRNGIIPEIILWRGNDGEGQESDDARQKGDFVRTADGIWLPQYMECTSDNLWTWKATLKATANVSFPDETFVLTFVPGYVVRDNIAGISFTAGYQTDEAILDDIVEAAGDLEAVRDGEQEPVDTVARDDPSAATKTPPDRKRRPLFLFICGCLVLVGVAITVAMLIRRHRRRMTMLLLFLLAAIT